MHYTIAGWQIALLWLVPALLFALLSRPTEYASQMAVIVQRIVMGGACVVFYATTLIMLGFALYQRFQTGDWVVYQDADYFAFGNLFAIFFVTLVVGGYSFLFWAGSHKWPEWAGNQNRFWEQLPKNCLVAFFIVGYAICGPLVLMLRIGQVKKKEKQPLPAWVDPMDPEHSRPFAASPNARLAVA